MTLPPDTVIFATDTSEAGIADARGWLKQQNYTGEQVKIVKREKQCLIIAKVQINAPKRIF